jgi:hypothetical protein
MSLGRTAYMRIAGHHGDSVHIHGKNDRLQTQPAAGQGGLTSGMAGADYTYICGNMIFHIYISFPKLQQIKMLPVFVYLQSVFLLPFPNCFT